MTRCHTTSATCQVLGLFQIFSDDNMFTFKNMNTSSVAYNSIKIKQQWSKFMQQWSKACVQFVDYKMLVNLFYYIEIVLGCIHKV